MVIPPILVRKANVMIGYNPIYEYAALPDVERIVAAIKRSVATKLERATVEVAVPAAESDERGRRGDRPYTTTPKIDMSKGHAQKITVPIMGEGIRNAKIVSLLKKPGDAIALDDDLCEVETDKAVYPIQSSFAGTMGEWKTKIGDMVDIGQELGTIMTSDAAGPRKTVEAGPSRTGTMPVAKSEDRGRHDRHYSIEPALSPTITRKLSRVIPANLQMDARWD